MRRLRRLTLLLAVVLLGACSSTTAPTPTAGSMDDAIANLVLRGITVHRLVSGDPGCQSADVHDNAVHMEVSVDNRSATHDVYLFRWRRAAEFQAGVGTFQDCLAEYEAAHPGTTITALEVAPWRAYGPGWPPDLEARLRDALVEASRV